MDEGAPKADVAEVAIRLARSLDELQQAYAIGGAISLGFWGIPRGTLDVDLTLFMAPEQPSECLRVLQRIGCEFKSSDALESLQQRRFCRVRCDGRDIDVFFPSNPFYEVARKRRKEVLLRGSRVMIWDAETIAVFKMLFFREKDIVDLKQLLTASGDAFDRQWVEAQLVELCGPRDPRVVRWHGLAADQ